MTDKKTQDNLVKLKKNKWHRNQIKKKAQSPIKQILKDIIEKTLAYKNDKKKTQTNLNESPKTGLIFQTWNWWNLRQ
jgi:uncharacterized protein with ATP-grasp and redox domains